MSKKLKLTIFSAIILSGVIGVAATFAAKGLGNSSPVTNSTNSNSLDSASKLVDENVYVFAKTDGSTRKIISSDWTRNLDVDEYLSIRDDNKKIPIELKVTYTLDGKEISGNDLAGKSGKVTMRYEYTNRSIASGYYVPYAVVSGLMLDNEHFKNIEVKNGKLINDGARTIVAGLMMPGMQENLGLSSADFEIPSYLEITTDASNFELGMVVSVVTNEIFSDLDFSGLNSVEQLSAELNKMSSAMDQLVGGSADLTTGIEKLYEKASALPDGVAKLSAGSLELKAGTAKLDAGVAQLQNKVKTNLQTGANQIVGDNYANSTALSAGVEKLANNVIGSTLTQYNPSFEPLFPIFETVDLPAEALTHDNYNTILTAWIAAMDKPEVVAILSNYGQNAQELKVKFNTLKTSLIQLDTLIAQTKAYTEGVNQVAAGINNELILGIDELKAGTTKIAAGTSELSNGVETLNNSAPALVDGISQLRDGSTKLSAGLKQFNEEAVKKLVNVYNNNVRGIIDRLQAISNVAKNNSSKTKYIYRIDEIKK
ncbi:hypothetical protein IJG91_01810 [Candidatus Saccharibacteria bacterium]|nr:hypothetical protein [Candidatus Saccharibacteria bacterium]